MTDSRKTYRRRLHGKIFKFPVMISCDEFEDFILAYLDDELSRRQKFIFETHLKVCRECCDYLKAYRISIDLAKTVADDENLSSPEDIPQDLIDAVLDSRKA